MMKAAASLLRTTCDQSLEKRLTPPLLILIFLCCALGTVVMSFSFYSRSVQYPPCAVCDATLYGAHAHQIQLGGLFKKFDDQGKRTLGYPLFVSIVTSKDAFVPGPWAVLDPGVPIAQTIAFLLAVGALAWSTTRISSVLCAACSAGLLINPFVIVYLSQRLTEGLVISLLVVLAAIAIRICSKPGWVSLFFLALAGSVTAGFAQITRPGCLPVLIAWLVFLIVVSVRGRDASKAISLTIAALIGLASTLTPQIVYNSIHFEKFTFLPAYDLGGFQVTHGLKFLKYHTMIEPAAPNGATGIAFANPFLTEHEIQESGASVYIVNPIGGLMTATMHVLNSINHDYFYVYLSSSDPRPNTLVNASWHFMLFMAVSGALRMWRRYRSSGSSSMSFDAIALSVLFCISVFGTLAVNSISAAETRFGILIFLLAGPLSVIRILELRREGMADCSLLLAQGSLYAVCASTISTLAALELLR